MGSFLMRNCYVSKFHSHQSCLFSRNQTLTVDNHDQKSPNNLKHLSFRCLPCSSSEHLNECSFKTHVWMYLLFIADLNLKLLNQGMVETTNVTGLYDVVLDYPVSISMKTRKITFLSLYFFQSTVKKHNTIQYYLKKNQTGRLLQSNLCLVKANCFQLKVINQCDGCCNDCIDILLLKPFSLPLFI